MLNSGQLAAWLFVLGSVLYTCLAGCAEFSELVDSPACASLSSWRPGFVGGVLYLVGSLIMARDSHLAPDASSPQPPTKRKTSTKRKTK